LKRAAVLFHPDSAPFAPLYLQAAQDAGERIGLKITAAGLPSARAIEPAVATMAGDSDGGLLVLPDVFFNGFRSARTIALAAKYRVPAIYPNRPYVVAGGLMSYGANPQLSFRDCATYVDRILRGTK